MLRAGADAADESCHEDVVQARSKRGNHDGKPEEDITGSHEDSARHERNNKSAKALKQIADNVVGGGVRSNRDKTNSQVFHHGRIENAEHCRLKVIEKMGAAND